MAGAGLASRLYRGEVSYDFIGRRRRWYVISALVVLISVASLLVLHLKPGIEFSGGAVFDFPANGHSISQVRAASTAAGVTPQIVQQVGEGRIRLQTASLPTGVTTRLQDALAQRTGQSPNAIAVSTVGPTWGSQITNKALEGLVIFLVVILAYLSIRFEPKMALAAFVALIHDLLVTAGIYSIVGFEVTPSTVIALLTILGYSLYDTVVVFDKVRENTAGLAGGSRMTFSQAANLAVNQTLVRSINTSIIALLPVAALLFIGYGLLGAGTLKDLSLALFIGLGSGAYSSIFIATPLVCDLKEREPQFRALARRVEGRVAAARQPAFAAAGTDGGTGRPPVVAPDTPTAPTAPTASDTPAAGGTPARGASARPAARKPGRGGRPGRPSGKRRR